MRTRRLVRFWNIKVLIVFLETGPIYWVSPKSFIVTKPGIESGCETAYIVMPIDKKNTNTDTTTINLRRRFFCSVNSEHFSRKFCWRIFSCNTSTLVACPHNNCLNGGAAWPRHPLWALLCDFYTTACISKFFRYVNFYSFSYSNNNGQIHLPFSLIRQTALVKLNLPYRSKGFQCQL